MSTRNISINLLVTLLILFLMDAYVYMALRKSMARHSWNRIWQGLYFSASALGFIGFYYFYTYFTVKPLQVEFVPNLLIGYFFSFFVFKLLLILFFFSEDLVRLGRLLYSFVRNLVLGRQVRVSAPGRRNFIRQTGLFLAAIPFTSMIYGITKGKYNYKVNKVKLSFKNLPEAFEGFRIVQISDIHSGSFDNREAVLEGISLINAQNPDLILFTGDMVNNDSREVEPFLQDFRSLQAKEGVYSVLGNHDYGDYRQWESAEEKEANQKLLHRYQEEMGFRLLNNTGCTIGREGQEIGLFGVENWGNPPFPQRGDLDRAVSGNEHQSFKILMSHDPTHWNQKVISHPVHFDLTLSGHTHGMQFGVEIPGIQWSPIKYIYPQWAGLYREAGQYLYVNRGFGFLGFPGRVGIWPEITVFELYREV